MKLREIRKLKGLTQKEVAENLGIAQVTYCNYELGNREPDIKTLIKMSQLFHATIDELVGNENDYLLNTKLLSEEEQSIIENIQKLNKNNLLKVEAYVYACLERQNEEKNDDK